MDRRLNAGATETFPFRRFYAYFIFKKRLLLEVDRIFPSENLKGAPRHEDDFR